MSNRYNSIVETLKAPCLNPDTLSAYGAAGATIAIPAGSLVSNTSMGGSSPDDAVPVYNFDIRDVPAVKAFGIFCSLGDGLAVQKQNTADGMPFFLNWYAVNALGVNVGNPIVTVPLYGTLFNTYETVDLFRLFNSPAARAILTARIASGATNTRLRIVFEQQWDFAAYSMATAWDAAFLSIDIHCIVEHTFPLEAP